ncbi:MAG: hypothetical protein AB7L92_04385 [Alphaproteobacteria bacterium]
MDFDDKNKLADAAADFLTAPLQTTMPTMCGGNAGAAMRSLKMFLLMEMAGQEMHGDQELLDVMKAADTRLARLLDTLQRVKSDGFLDTATPEQVIAAKEVMKSGVRDMQRILAAIELDKRHYELALGHFKETIADDTSPTKRRKISDQKVQKSYEGLIGSCEAMLDATAKLGIAYQETIGKALGLGPDAQELQ